MRGPGPQTPGGLLTFFIALMGMIGLPIWVMVERGNPTNVPELLVVYAATAVGGGLPIMIYRWATRSHGTCQCESHNPESRCM